MTAMMALRERLVQWVLAGLHAVHENVLISSVPDKVALVAADELEGLMETAHLLRSPRNATRLLTALLLGNLIMAACFTAGMLLCLALHGGFLNFIRRHGGLKDTIQGAALVLIDVGWIAAGLRDHLAGAVDEQDVLGLAALYQRLQGVGDRPVVLLEDGPFGSDHETISCRPGRL